MALKEVSHRHDFPGIPPGSIAQRVAWIRRLDGTRYVLGETAISVAVNAAINGAIGGVAAASALGDRASAVDILAPTFMSGLMSALIPLLLTRRRQRNGRLPPSLNRCHPNLKQIAAVALAAALSCTALSASLVRTLSTSISVAMRAFVPSFLIDATYGGLIAAAVTPLVLILIFGSGAAGAKDTIARNPIATR